MNANRDRLYTDVEYLTSIVPSRNFQHQGSLVKAAEYIEAAFSAAGISTARQTWHVNDKPFRNVIASFNSHHQRKLIVGAHYDVYGDQPGADDNASAVAGLMELVRMVAHNKPFFNYGIEFVAYCLEEPPFFASEEMGSYIHATSLYETKANVLGMISLEMIGYFSDQPHSQSFPSPELKKQYPHTGNFIIVVGLERYAAFSSQVHRLMSAASTIDVQVIHFQSGDGLAGLSDQRNYWQFGYNALMVNDTAFLRNPNYHLKSDTIDTLDFVKMTAVVNATYNAITKLV